MSIINMYNFNYMDFYKLKEECFTEYMNIFKKYFIHRQDVELYDLYKYKYINMYSSFGKFRDALTGSKQSKKPDHEEVKNRLLETWGLDNGV